MFLLSGCDSLFFNTSSKKEAQKETLAIQTSEIKTYEDGIRLEGLATILSPDQLLQIDADIRAATVSAEFSKDKLMRYKTSDGLAQQELFDAERQSLNDETQLHLLESRLKQTWGDQAPFLNSEDRKSLIVDLSLGSKAIVRLDLPEILNEKIANIKIVPLHGQQERSVDFFWNSPAGNQFMTGVSYFGIIETAPGLKPGDRGRFFAEKKNTKTGIVIPEASIIVYGGQSWCYVETVKDKFERRRVTLDAPVEGGYLIEAGSAFQPGMRVVVRGASVLLSREAGPNEDDEASDKGEVAKDGDSKTINQIQDEKRSLLFYHNKNSIQIFVSTSHNNPVSIPLSMKYLPKLAQTTEIKKV
ncbi:MAG: hypothetical protein ACKOW3_01890 [Hyphomicrobium sp.]